MLNFFHWLGEVNEQPCGAELPTGLNHNTFKECMQLSETYSQFSIDRPAQDCLKCCI